MLTIHLLLLTISEAWCDVEEFKPASKGVEPPMTTQIYDAPLVGGLQLSYNNIIIMVKRMKVVI